MKKFLLTLILLIPDLILSIGNGAPIKPVLATSTSSILIDNFVAVSFAISAVAAKSDAAKADKTVLNQMDLKLSNYRQTARVLTQEGVEPVKTGGCMYCDATPIEYRPQYQNRMYY